MDKKLDHIGIVVCDIENSIQFYTNVLFGKLIDRYISELLEWKVKWRLWKLKGDRIELLAPTNNTTSPIARFIKQKGKGVHHIAYRVEDLDQAIEELKEQGIRTLEGSLRVNKHGRRLIYLNPADTVGTIIEYCDYLGQK